ncbi:MAG: hypothetical protein QM803_11580 [Rhodocyclaceae bacterium]
MSVKERKSKRLICKQATHSHNPSRHLHTDVALALNQLKVAGSRRELLGSEEAPVYRQIIRYQSGKTMVFGLMALYEPGTNAASLVDDQTVEQLDVAQVAPPQREDGKREEFINSLLFFAVYKNFVVAMQSMQLRTDHLESHLNWLLRTASAIKKNEYYGLLDLPTPSAKDKLFSAPIKEINLGAQPLFVLSSQAVDAGKGVASTELHTSWASAGLDFLKGLLSPAQYAKLDSEKMEQSNIEYSLRIKCRTSTTEADHKLLRNVATALRNHDLEDTKITLADGKEIQGNDLKLTQDVRVDTYNGIPYPESVFEEMRQWLHQLVASKAIGP